MWPSVFFVTHKSTLSPGTYVRGGLLPDDCVTDLAFALCRMGLGPCGFIIPDREKSYAARIHMPSNLRRGGESVSVCVYEACLDYSSREQFRMGQGPSYDTIAFRTREGLAISAQISFSFSAAASTAAMAAQSSSHWVNISCVIFTSLAASPSMWYIPPISHSL